MYYMYTGDNSSVAIDFKFLHNFCCKFRTFSIFFRWWLVKITPDSFVYYQGNSGL